MNKPSSDNITSHDPSFISPLQMRYENLRSERETLIETLQNQIQSEHSLKYDIQLLVEMLASYYPDYVEIEDLLKTNRNEFDEMEKLVNQDNEYTNSIIKDFSTIQNSIRNMKPFQVDMDGRLIMPLMLGKADARVSIQTIGIIPRYPDNYHNEEFIYPVGFLSKRKYADPRNRSRKCHYTCEIFDGGPEGPIFHISSHGIISLENRSLPRLFQEVIRIISNAFVTEIDAAASASEHHIFSSGEEFFGLEHANIKKLIEVNEMIYSII